MYFPCFSVSFFETCRLCAFPSCILTCVNTYIPHRLGDSTVWQQYKSLFIHVIFEKCVSCCLQTTTSTKYALALPRMLLQSISHYRLARLHQIGVTILILTIEDLLTRDKSFVIHLEPSQGPPSNLIPLV